MSSMRVELEAAYVLHARAYQETSQLLEVMSEQHGRVGLVARGARRPTSRWRSLLQPFMPLRLSWSGRGTLFTLRAAEPAGSGRSPEGMALMGAFYLNELLINFLKRGDPHPGLFPAYSEALDELRDARDPEPALRRFELRLLAESGYGLNLGHDIASDLPVEAGRLYEYRIEQGPAPAPGDEHSSGTGSRTESRAESGAGGWTDRVGESTAPAYRDAARPGPLLVFPGADLLAIRNGDFSDPAVLASAKRLLRAVLAHHLDGRTLRTRAVMASMRR